MSEEEIYNYLISFVSRKIKQHKLILQDMAGFNLGYLLTEDLQKAVQGLMDLRKTEQEKNVELRTITMTFDNLFGINFISKDKIKEAIESKISCCRAEELEDNYIDDKHSQYWKMFRELLEKLEQELLEEGE